MIYGRTGFSRLRIKQNKFGGHCAGCGQWVQVYGGQLEKQDGRWVVFHGPTCIRLAGEIAGQTAREEAAERYAERTLSTDGPVFNGERYE
jgi:hypothetical protein